MNTFRAATLALRVRNLTAIKDNLHRLSESPMRFSLDETARALLKETSQGISDCRAIGLTDAARTLVHVKTQIELVGLDAVRLEREAIRAHDALLDDIDKLSWVYVPADVKKYLDHSALFGPVVHDKFPGARRDIREAGNCLAFGCGTASVFHLMRVSEVGLRAFASHLGVRRLKSVAKKDPISGIAVKHHYTPVSHSQWETILNGLPKRITKRLGAYQKGPTKQANQEFYDSVMLDLNAIRTAFRNHVMHSRQNYEPPEAEAVRFRVEAIMKKLALKLREV
jgi:hypothetical protein